MKKILSLFLLLAFILLAACSSENEKTQQKNFCYTASDEQSFAVTDNAKQYIISTLDDVVWSDNVPNCEGDFIFYIQDREIHYHSSCGTFNDYTNKKSSTLSHEQSAIINAMLGIE